MSEGAKRDRYRVLLLTPRGRDANVAQRILQANEVACEVVDDIGHLCRELLEGAGAALVAVEALPKAGVAQLAETLKAQPSWSDVPLILFASPELGSASLDPLRERHFTVLDRPLSVKTLVTATRAAISARKRQYEVRQLMEELEARVRERDRFLAILGHELRNPLGAILLATQMVDGDSGALAREHATLIERQARHLTRLVDDLLDLSRVTAGKIVLQKRQIELRPVIAQAVKIVSEAAGDHVQITFEAPNEPIVVDGDPVRLDQILANLLNNSVKYTRAGGRVDVELTRNETRATIKVKDTGVGIPPDRLKTIFGLFAQAENAIGRSQGGMGIGLSLVRNLVELHGGSVTASSDGVDRGSCFTVELPLAQSDVPAAAPSAAHVPSTDETRRVVIVEDNPDLRMLLQLKLKRLRHEVSVASDGESGVEEILRVQPDIAFVDIGLPGIDGYTVAARVREQLGGNVFLVALSGFGQPEDKQRALAAGFDDHLTKPAEIGDLEKMLRRAGGRD